MQLILFLLFAVSSHFVTLIAPFSRGASIVFILFRHGQRWGDANLV